MGRGRGSDEETLPPLLPRPRRAERRPGRLVLRDGLPIVLEPGSDDRDFATACALRDAVAAAAGVRLRVETHLRSDDLGPRIALRREADAGESYRLRVDPDLAELCAAGPAGLRYATETLVQLLDARGALPACVVDDAPDFPYRGVMLDVSRGKVPTEAQLRALVDLCARLKLNVLMLYVEHTFRSRRHPAIGADADGLEAETLRALDAYAAERGVELVPNLQSLGHMEHVLKLPAYAELAETDARWTRCCAISTRSTCRTSARGSSTRTATRRGTSARGARRSSPSRWARAGSSSSTCGACARSRATWAAAP